MSCDQTSKPTLGSEYGVVSVDVGSVLATTITLQTTLLPVEGVRPSSEGDELPVLLLRIVDTAEEERISGLPESEVEGMHVHTQTDDRQLTDERPTVPKVPPRMKGDGAVPSKLGQVPLDPAADGGGRITALGPRPVECPIENNNPLFVETSAGD